MGLRSRLESWTRFFERMGSRSFWCPGQTQSQLFPLVSANPSSYFQETLLFHSWRRTFWGASQPLLKANDRSLLFCPIRHPACPYSVPVSPCSWLSVWPDGNRQLGVLHSRSLQVCPGVSTSQYLGRDLLVDTCFPVFGHHPVKKRDSSCLRCCRYTG